MKSITFIVNELTVTNTPSLKRRDAGRIDMGFERALYPLIVSLEAYPNGTHFKVTVEAIEDGEPKKEEIELPCLCGDMINDACFKHN